MAETRYKVLQPYVTLKVRNQATGTSTILGYYQGATVPSEADPDDVKRLVDKGYLVREGTFEADVFAVPAGTPIPGEPPNVPVTEAPENLPFEERVERAKKAAGRAARSDAGDAKPGASERAEAKPEPPAAGEPKAAWVDHAVKCGEDRATAEAMSKEQLVGKYGRR